MIMGVTDTCSTKWVQDPLTATASVNIHCCRYHSRIKGHFVTIFYSVGSRSDAVLAIRNVKLCNIESTIEFFTIRHFLQICTVSHFEEY